MTRADVVRVLADHPRAHLRQTRVGHALAEVRGVEWVALTDAEEMTAGELVTARARVASVREHLAGAWQWVDGRCRRQPSILDTITALAWADGSGRLVVHLRPPRPARAREIESAPQVRDARQMTLEGT